MRLINKTILYYLLISLPLLVVAGFLSYYLIRYEVRESADELLWKEKLNSEKLLRTQHPIQKLYLGSDSLSFIVPISGHEKKYTYYDSVIPEKGEEVNYRLLKSHITINNQTFLIKLAKPTMEEDELMEGLFSAFAIIFSFLILAFFAVNWLLSKTLWKPFYKTLHDLKEYDLKNYSNAKFTTSNTKEFNQLNVALNKMTEKVYHDYLQQKEFTENASHEMQTPLAIIKANINLLMQSPNLKAEEMEQLQAIDNTIKKLTSLNKALLLLAKIENHQFKENSSFTVNSIVKKVLAHFEDLLVAKHIMVDNSIAEEVFVNMNAPLAEILITNLVQNAIRHNSIGGKIIISIKDNSLIIANTGEPLRVDSKDLFVRFKKNDASKESLGLGLSIVKSIAALYNYNISYNYHNSLHIFTLNF
ncbi:MAG: HAMP domain-containing histidine kinase [Bacteroidetes bacterium]|nr:HAMP domain-containing histidine kinase [Bacteroidota bacterium]